MKIDINGVIRDMTEEEIQEYEEAMQDVVEIPATLDEKMDKLTEMVEGLTDLLQNKLFGD